MSSAKRELRVFLRSQIGWGTVQWEGHDKILL